MWKLIYLLVDIFQGLQAGVYRYKTPGGYLITNHPLHLHVEDKISSLSTGISDHCIILLCNLIMLILFQTGNGHKMYQHP